MNSAGLKVVIDLAAEATVLDNTGDKPVDCRLATACQRVNQRRRRGLREGLETPVARRNAIKAGRIAATDIQHPAPRGISEHRLGRRDNLAAGLQHRKMRDHAGEQPHIIIGDAERLGPVHDLQLLGIEPGRVQHHIGAARGKRCAGHGAVIADRRRMHDIAIMQDQRRDRHHRLVAELAAQLHRRTVRADRQHRHAPLEDRRVRQLQKPSMVENIGTFRRGIGIVAGALVLGLVCKI